MFHLTDLDWQVEKFRPDIRFFTLNWPSDQISTADILQWINASFQPVVLSDRVPCECTRSYPHVHTKKSVLTSGCFLSIFLMLWFHFVFMIWTEQIVVEAEGVRPLALQRHAAEKAQLGSARRPQRWRFLKADAFHEKMKWLVKKKKS